MAETEGEYRETQEGVGQRFREGYERVGHAVGHGYRRAEGLVASHPTSSLLLGFSVGLGVGVLLTLALAQPPEEPWWRRDWKLAESLRQLQNRVGQLAHGS